jgi:hypothetical protein
VNERDFKGVWIPKVVWLDSRLSALDKVILTEIDSLDQGERGCYASNKHIADFCQCSEAKVTKSVSMLIKFGYLYVQKFDGRQRELRSRLSKFTGLPSKNYESESQKLRQSNTGNNTSTNTTRKRESTKRKPFVPPTLEEVEKYCESRNNAVNARKFFDYFTASDWVDAKGNPVRNWKQKIITWESYGSKDNGNNDTANGDTKKQRVGHYL